MNIELITNVEPLWTPNDIAFITDFRKDGKNLIIDFVSQRRSNARKWPDEFGNFNKLSISFLNVHHFRTDFDNFQLQQVMGFEIIDLSDRNLEGINFLIQDVGNSVIEFHCEKMEIIDFEINSSFEYNAKYALSPLRAGPSGNSCPR